MGSPQSQAGGFQREFEDWARRHPERSVKGATASTVPFPVPIDDEMQDRRQKIFVPQGALLVWDSRMPHENFPNEGGSWRIVQYVTCKRLSPSDLERRACAWRAGLRTGLVPAGFARRFSAAAWALLGMAASASEPDLDPLLEALRAGEALAPELLEAAQRWRRAYRLKQTAIDPLQLKEAGDLFRAAFATNPALREVLQRVAAAEASYLPFWIL